MSDNNSPWSDSESSSDESEIFVLASEEVPTRERFVTASEDPVVETQASEEKPPSESEETPTTEDPPYRFVMKKWDAVVSWSYDTKVETCAICRHGIMDICVECQEEKEEDKKKKKDDDEDCPVAWGKCNHAFHLHCLLEILEKTNQVCPLCTKQWEFQDLLN